MQPKLKDYCIPAAQQYFELKADVSINTFRRDTVYHV